MLVGAGDIGVCGVDGAERTARLLDGIGGIVFTTGDHAYSNGTRDDFTNCYEPFWGRHTARTRPTPGNHEYRTADAAAYFDYFGSNAGPWGLGYYSFTAGAWLVLSLNSNVPANGGSAQLAWLRDRLTTQPSQCVAVIWHHPLVSSGRYGRDATMRDVWRTLMEFKADLVLAGHDHAYERFAPLDDTGFPHPDGIRSFVVGTGGAPLYEFVSVQPGSERWLSEWGVLKLTLRSGAYDWEFISVDGAAVRDTGTQACR